MKPVSIIFFILGFLFIVFVLRLLSFISVGTSIAETPWWIYLIYLGLVLSGVMYIYTRLEEKRIEQKLIEEEGQQFLLRYKERNNIVK